MATLTSCLKKAGKAVSNADAQEMRQLQADFRADGLDGAAASIEAVETMLTMARQEKTDLVGEVRSQGGKTGRPRFREGREPPQTISKKFKKWFRKSVATNWDGSPEVLYHFTSADFNELDMGFFDIGFHLGTQEQANARFEDKKALLDFQPWNKDKTPNIMPLYARIENPLRMADVGDWNDPGLVRKWLKMNKAYKKAGGKTKIPGWDNMNSRERLDALRAAIQKAGFDGIVYENEVEGGGGTGDMGLFSDENESYIVFEPTQVKSATGNIGTFDPKKADIRFAEGVLGPEATNKETLTDYFSRTDDEFWGVSGEDPAQFDSGYDAVQCTGFACAIAKKLGSGRVRIKGFFVGDNPGTKIEQVADGHDFAVVDGRYIVDPWLAQVESGLIARPMEVPSLPGTFVFDMKDPADRAQIKEVYGDPKKWKEVSNAYPSGVEPGPDVGGRKKKMAEGELAKGITEIAQDLTAEEVAPLNRKTAKAVVDAFKTLPSVEEYGTVAAATKAARGWYTQSAKALNAVFGQDAPRFAALMAALSPQTSVEFNLLNAVKVWQGWVEAGRPTHRSTILKIAGQNVQGTKGQESVLDAWKNNLVTALKATDPTEIKLSGNKVNSFMRNLVGEAGFVTNDAWMANFGLTSKNITQSMYRAMTAKVRKAARWLTQETGETWTPMEVQETVWAWAKTLVENATAAGETRSAWDIINDAEFTNDIIAGAENVADLFEQDRFRAILQSPEFAGALDRLEEVGPKTPSGEGTTAVAEAGQEYLKASAERLDQLIEKRRKAKRKKFSEGPDLNATQAAALAKANLVKDERPLTQRVQDSAIRNWQAFKVDLGDRIKQGIADKFNRIKSLEKLVGGFAPEQSGYVASRLSAGAPTTLRAFLLHGAGEWKDGIVQMKEGSKGLLDSLTPVAEEVDRWMGWMVGGRAKRLKAEGRENLFTDEDIKALRSLADTPERKARYEQAAKDYGAWQKSILDLGEAAGLIDPEQRQLWEHGDYIPFYREGHVPASYSGKKGIADQTSPIRRLRGGTENLIDPLSGIIQNAARMIEGAMKNHAMLQTIDNLQHLEGLFENVSPQMKSALIPLSQLKRVLAERGVTTQMLTSLPKDALRGLQKVWSINPPTGPDVVRVMRNGKAEYYKVNDELLFRSLTGVNQQALESTKWMRPFKQLLTSGVTTDPAFMIRNFLRDSLHAWVITDSGFKPGIDSIKGLYKQATEKGGMIDMMFAGGSFNGGYINAADPEEMTSVIRRTLREKNMKPADINRHINTIMHPTSKMWAHWRKVGETFENANREAIFEAAVGQGKSKAQAVFEAKDIMDFSMRGDYMIVRFFTDVLPFTNARIQGLYKLGRAFSEADGKNRAKMIARGTAITAATLGLLAMNWGDEEYEKLEEWDKDTYWHIRPGTKYHTRIPKPFEVGLLFGTVPERFFRAYFGADDSEVFMRSMLRGFGETLAFNPVPQVFAPVGEVLRNQSWFTKRPIEGMADEGKLVEARYNESTSRIMRALSEMGANKVGLSPKQLEHLWRGYTGTMGAYILKTADWMHDEATGRAPRPEKNIRQIPVVGSFFRGEGPAPSTKYQTELYEMLKESEQIYRTMRSYAREGRMEKAREIMEEEGFPLSVRKSLRNASTSLSDLRKAMDAIYRRQDMDPAKKREAIDHLLRRRNMIAQSVMESVERAEEVWLQRNQ